jgi:hypothetical protein
MNLKDREDDHDDHEGDHDDLHLEMHRAVDELGKYAIDMELTTRKELPKDKVKRFIEDLMIHVTKNCMLKGADLIGHIKSILICDGGNIMSSVIDDSAKVRMKDSITSSSVVNGKFTMHIIVHGIWDDKVREAVLEVLPGEFRKWDIPFRIVADHYDTEKSAAHHT